MSATGYRQIEHTADLALELWAPTQEDLLRVAARAVVDLLTGVPEAASPTPAATPTAAASRHIHITAIDAEDRLVQWINEVIVAAVTDGFLVTGADIELHENGLSAELHGHEGAGDRIVTELKSATYHDLELTSPDDVDDDDDDDDDADGRHGWRARVVIDV